MFNEKNAHDLKLSSEFTDAAHQLKTTLDINKSTIDTQTSQHCVPTLPTVYNWHTNKSALCTDTPYSFTYGFILFNTLSSNAHGLQVSNIGNNKVSRIKQFACFQIRLHFTSHWLRTSNNSPCWASGVPQTAQTNWCLPSSHISNNKIRCCFPLLL
jgi:hypothetical protein